MSRTDPLRFAVTATDTGVGKTSASMALLSLLVKRGERPFAFKPYESGLTPGAESDSEKLWRAAGQWQPKETVCLHRFREPVAPGIAARRESRSPSWASR